MTKPELLKYAQEATTFINATANDEHAKIAVLIRIATAAESLSRDIHAIRDLAERVEKADT